MTTIESRIEAGKLRNLAAKCDRSEDDVEYQRLMWAADVVESSERVPGDEVSEFYARAEMIREVAEAIKYRADGPFDSEKLKELRAPLLAEADRLDAAADAIMEGPESC